MPILLSGVFIDILTIFGASELVISALAPIWLIKRIVDIYNK